MSAVESPDHYTQGYIEVIYLIAQTLGPKGFKDFCMGNYLKYRTRHEHKGGAEDLKKAEQYLDWAVNGLPAPINGRVPRNKPNESKQNDHVGSIRALLQHELDQKFQIQKDSYFLGRYDVVELRQTKWVNGYCALTAKIRDAVDGFEFTLELSKVSAAARYEDIVKDFIAKGW